MPDQDSLISHLVIPKWFARSEREERPANTSWPTTQSDEEARAALEAAANTPAAAPYASAEANALVAWWFGEIGTSSEGTKTVASFIAPRSACLTDEEFRLYQHGALNDLRLTHGVECAVCAARLESLELTEAAAAHLDGDVRALATVLLDDSAPIATRHVAAHQPTPSPTEHAESARETTTRTTAGRLGRAAGATAAASPSGFADSASRNAAARPGARRLVPAGVDASDSIFPRDAWPRS